MLLHGQSVIVSAPDGQNWFAKTYGTDTTNSDPYYQENLVIGDLPAGDYTIRINYAGGAYSGKVTIYPGLVSYFEFWGYRGFEIGQAPSTEADFSPLATLTPAKRP